MLPDTNAYRHSQMGHLIQHPTPNAKLCSLGIQPPRTQIILENCFETKHCCFG